MAAPARVAVVVTPAPRGSRSGNRVTALRWAAILRALGWRVRVRERWIDEGCGLLVAVHSVKSAASVLAASRAMPGLRVVVLLAGTDVYPRFAPDADTEAALLRADAVITLQPRAGAEVPAALRPKVRTIVQSATALERARPEGTFRICVLAHLRPVKDPLLPVTALGFVRTGHPLELHLAGRAMTSAIETQTRTALAREPRATWHGSLSRRAARELLASSHLCVVPSSAEGGANVVSEAIASGTPIAATAIPGNLGLLGDDWPATFPVGDARGLGALIERAVTDPSFHQSLVQRTRALQPMVEPRREYDAWRRLLHDLGC